MSNNMLQPEIPHPFCEWPERENQAISGGVVLRFWPSNGNWYSSEVSYEQYPGNPGLLKFWGPNWATSKRNMAIEVIGTPDHLRQVFIIYTLTGEVNGEKV